MGNTNRKSPGLNLEIQTQRAFYNSGSSIEGVVFLQAQESHKYDALYVRVEGEEWCRWHEGTSKNGVRYTGNDKFYMVEYQLCKFKDNQVKQGKHAFPFSIELSENIPGSFHSPTHDARISYKLKAYLVKFNQSNKQHHCSIELMIREPFRQEMSGFEGVSKKKPVSCGCCGGDGQVELKASFDRNVCFEGEKVAVDIEVNNSQGKGPVNDIIVKVVQYTFVSANNGVSRTYQNNIYSTTLPSRVAKGKHQSHIHHQIPVPHIEQQTAISTLVANYYRIEVVASSGTFSSDNPSIYSPLYIMKTSVPPKGKAPMSKINHNIDSFKTHPSVAYRAQEYWFRKNRNLSVMNFRIEDIMNAEAEELVEMK